jgi:hypothetical protein
MGACEFAWFWFVGQNIARSGVLRRCMEAASSQALANMFWAHARLWKVGIGFVCEAYGVAALLEQGRIHAPSGAASSQRVLARFGLLGRA